MSQNIYNMWNSHVCVSCNYRNVCFIRQVSLQGYSEQVRSFLISVLNMEFSYRQQENKWYANYWVIQEQLVYYYNTHGYELEGNRKPFLTNESQRENDREKIRELFKQMLDAAAKAYEDKNPEISIILDGIGLVLASDYVEAVSKIFSMLKTAIKIDNHFSGRCSGYKNCS